MRRVKAGEAALYHWEMTHCRINDFQIETINDTVVSNRDLEHWKKVVSAWLLRGYSPKNLEGPLEWFRKGIPTGGKRPASRESHYDEAQLARDRAEEKPFDLDMTGLL